MTLYFVSSLLIFSSIIGSVFFVLFNRHNRRVYTAELTRRAVSIADTISDYLSSNPRQSGMHGMGMGYGGYIRFLEDIAMSDVWVLDRDEQPLNLGHAQGWLTSQPLPKGAKNVIGHALGGQEAYLIREESTIVAAQIVNQNGMVAGVVLLQGKVETASGETSSGLMILLTSMGVATLLSFAVAAALSTRFTEPLRKMKRAALRITAGDFDARTQVQQPDEIGELAHAMDDMAARLAEASKEDERQEKLKREFLASVSHELRTPVTVIRGSLEALCEQVVIRPEQVDEYHRQMLKESIHLQRLVSDMMELTRLQNPDFTIEAGQVEMSDLLSDAVRGMRRIAGQKNITVELSIESYFNIIGDYGRLRQMLTTVLDNAVKFSPEGGAVRVSLEGEQKRARIRIRDEGAGMGEDAIVHIFDRFYRHPSEKNADGTGLGLTIAKQIADRHGIRIEVRSTLHQGTEFTFLFDAQRSEKE